MEGYGGEIQDLLEEVIIYRDIFYSIFGSSWRKTITKGNFKRLSLGKELVILK